MLEIKNLYKKYENNKNYSVQDLSLKIEEGEIFGFLGQNGAGKSTTMKCVLDILPFEKGEIIVNGHDLKQEPNKLKSCIGYVSDERTAYESLTGREYINFIGNVYSIDKDIISARLEECAKDFNMQELLDLPISTYSFGFKQLVSIISVIVRQPKLWILDEPIVGLDPEFASKIKKSIIKAKQNGSTIFFSSHYVEMLEKICDRVAIIMRGKILEIVDIKTFKQEGKNNLEEYYLELLESQKEEKWVNSWPC